MDDQVYVAQIFREKAMQIPRYRSFVVLFMFLFLIVPSVSGEDKTAKEQRNKINTLLKTFREGDRPVNIGFITAVVEESIKFGSKAVEEGNEKKAYEFYRSSVKDLLKLANSDRSVTEEASQAVDILREALRQSRSRSSASDQAWTMRYGFDRVLKKQKILKIEAKALIELGKKYYRNSQFWAAGDAFERQTRLLEELYGESKTDLSIDLRTGPFYYAHALFADGNFKKSAQALKNAHSYIPDWRKYNTKVERRKNFPDSSRYDRLLKNLKKQTRDAAQPALHFLLGYEYYMTEKKKQAREELENINEDSSYGEIAETYLTSLKDEKDSESEGEKTF